MIILYQQNYIMICFNLFFYFKILFFVEGCIKVKNNATCFVSISHLQHNFNKISSKCSRISFNFYIFVKLSKNVHLRSRKKITYPFYSLFFLHTSLKILTIAKVTARRHKLCLRFLPCLKKK